MRKILRFLTTLIICVANCGLQLPVTATNSGCDDVKIIFARGSGETLNDTSYLSWQTALTSHLQSTKLRYGFYELGSQAQNGARYPAVAVAGSLGGFGNLLGAYLSAGQSFDFGKSVLTGRNELKSYIKSISSICPNTKFVLGGYSQGAMVISGTLNELDARKIIYVATFGDPKLYLPEGAGRRPDACRGKNLSNYRTYVPDCHAYEGVLGSFRPYQPADYLDKIGTWCNGQDVMCSSGLSISDHTAYSSLGLYRNAANVIASKLRLTFPSAFTNSPTIDSNVLAPHNLLIVLYGAGDMNGLLLAQYKLAAQRLANQVYSLGGRVALYVYGDNSKWNMRKFCDFTCTADEFSAQLAKLTHSLSAVDSYNSGLSSLHRSMSELTWQVGATKSAVLLTPRPYSPIDYNGIRVADVAELSLSIDPVNIYPITHASSLESVQPLAQATNGKAYTIDQVNLAAIEITGRPMTSLSLEAYEGTIGEEITFDAQGTAFTSQNLRYDWDLDADGVFELQNNSAVVHKTYAQPTAGYIQVRVTDQNNYSSTMSASLKITATIPTAPTLADVQVTQLNNTTYRLDFVAQADQIWVAIGDLPMGHLGGTNRFLEISDVTARTTVRLIPYSHQAGRGAATTVEIGSEPSPAPEPLPEPNLTPTSTPDSTTGQDASPTSQPTPLVFIPKVPNTGVKPR